LQRGLYEPKNDLISVSKLVSMRRNLNLLIVIVILGLCLGSLSVASSASFNNVEINIQTSGIQADYFVVNAFNMSGYLESSTQTHYPAASFELPDGQYIFTASANNESSDYPVPLLTASTGAASSSGALSLPIYVAPVEEYGFLVQQVSNSMPLTITTQNVSQYPTNSLAVKVVYNNGSAAVGASVTASVIGSSYYWGYESNVVTWATTGEEGVAMLITPVAPVQINVWIWVPSNSTSYPAPKMGVPGQVVNGTVIAYPIYIGLAGSGLMVPPQTSVTVTLQIQQPNYWVVPYAGTASLSGTSVPGSSSSGYAAGPGSVPSSVYVQQQGSPNLQNFQVPSSTDSPQPTVSATTSSPDNITGNMFMATIVLIAVVAVAVVVVSLALVLRHKKKSIKAP
jgi:hypothetical protein